MLEENLMYEPETGHLYWTRPQHKRKLGEPVGTLKPNGYLQLCYNYKLYLNHRVAWYLHYGEWPHIVDHINGRKTDNRICNLRSVTQRENMRAFHERRSIKTPQT